MFNGSHIRLPFRILSEREVLQLSGLEDLWTNTSIEDAERLPERVIRDYCGNSFHPSLIYGALGNDLQLRRWVNGEAEGPETPVADKNTVLKIYTHLCREVEKLGNQHGYKLGPHIVKEFPPYPDPIGTHDFRAPVTTSFQFEEYFRFAFGCYSAQLASGVVRRCPDLTGVSMLQLAFQRFTECKTRFALIDCLTTAVRTNRSSHWTVGHFVVSSIQFSTLVRHSQKSSF